MEEEEKTMEPGRPHHLLRSIGGKEPACKIEMKKKAGEMKSAKLPTKKLNFQSIYAQGSQGAQVSLREKKGSIEASSAGHEERKDPRSVHNRKLSSRISSYSTKRGGGGITKTGSKKSPKKHKGSIDYELYQTGGTRLTEPDI